MEENEAIREIGLVIIASLLVSLILALKVHLPRIGIGIFDFVKMFGLSLLMLGVFVIAQKITANFIDCKTKTKLFTFRRYWFKPLAERGTAEFSFDFPLWLVLPLILLFITNGLLKWTAILDFDIEPKPSHVRRKWSELSEDDVGKIAIAGPIAVLILGFIVRIAGFSSFAIICSWLALLALIPIGLGFKLLNSSRLLWFFSLLFSFFILVLMKLASVFATIVIALLLAVIITIAYYITYEK